MKFRLIEREPPAPDEMLPYPLFDHNGMVCYRCSRCGEPTEFEGDILDVDGIEDGIWVCGRSQWCLP